MSKTIGIIDEPVQPGAQDQLDISAHAISLIKFISATSTPITVGIQGEWGSGKTSLINSIYHHFESEQKVKQIWINSWEYSLLSSPEETLLKIVNRIIEELIEADKNSKRIDAIKGGAEKIFKGALRVGAGITMGNAAADVAKELLDSSEQTISSLRKQLTEVVNEMSDRPTNPYEKVVIYVDDLDRIEPKNAVAILELLKNIFSVPKCVFILAIDYQVVVKGLEHKFGNQTAENEWEFRAFFDKIIQLPFMMPMGQYNIGKYVNSLLVDIGFVGGEGLDDEAVKNIIDQTIGGNPRSIKRLVNSVSLIQIFINERKLRSDTQENENDNLEIDEEDEKFLMFALVCLQIAFPAIYSLLSKEPNFTNWNEQFAFKQTNRAEERVGNLKPEEMKKIFEDEFEAAKDTEDFDEEWEKALFRICYVRPRLKPRAIDISKFFSYIKDVLLAENNDDIGVIIGKIMSQTSVTSVESTDQGQPPLPEREGAFKRRILNDLAHWKLDKETNHSGGLSGEKADIFDILYNDLNNEFENIEFLFAGAMTAYVAKHKFFHTQPTTLRSKFICTIRLRKHFRNNYKLPKIPNSDLIIPNRIYVSGERNTLRGAENYKIQIKNLEDYNKNKKIIFKLIGLSYDMALNHWDKKLNIHISRSNPGNGHFYSENVNIENDVEKIWQNADLVLDPSNIFDPSKDL